MKFAKIMATAVLSLALVTGCTVGTGIVSVNDEPITKAEYDKAYENATNSPQYMMLGKKNFEDQESLLGLITRDRVVNELITKKLLEQEIKKNDIKITNAEVEAKMEEVAKKVGGKKALDERLKVVGVSKKDLEKDIKEEIKIDKLIEKHGNITVTEAEIKKFYAENKARFTHKEQVRASHILIMAQPDKIKEEIISNDKKGELNAEQIEEKAQAKIAELKAKAQEIREKALKNPEGFAKLAKKYSHDEGSSKQGGDLGFFPKGQMVPEFEEVAFAIAPNSISEIVKTDYGFHIIMVTDRQKAGLDALEKVSAEIEALIRFNKKSEILKNLFEGLKASAKIEYIDENYKPEVIQEKIQKLLNPKVVPTESVK
ncbi:MAG: hypothetical protein E7Z91_01955 [Cyanobacteria bacterium SIG30]|nr:hypothetical protein [Cyanobacteria bacterium SIG30]